MSATVVDEYGECIHGMNPEWCAICRHPYTPPEPEHVERCVIAKFDGTCRACDEPILAGQYLALLHPSDVWVHFPQCIPS